MLKFNNKWIKIARLYHRYYMITGLYKFIFKSMAKVILILVALILAIYFIEKYIIDFDVFFERYIQGLNWYHVMLSFFVSEALLGLIPPDFYIIWAYKLPQNYQMITLLAILSYLGGIYSYHLGKLIRRIPRIKNYIHRRFDSHFKTIKKWGGIVVVIAALLPIPFSIISMIAGIVQYPVRSYLLYALARLPRFYLYAIIIFKVLK